MNYFFHFVIRRGGLTVDRSGYFVDNLQNYSFGGAMDEKKCVVSLVELSSIAALAAFEVDEFCLQRLRAIEAIPKVVALLDSWIKETDCAGLHILSETYRLMPGFTPLQSIGDLARRTNDVISALEKVASEIGLPKDKVKFLQQFLIQLSVLASQYCQKYN